MSVFFATAEDAEDAFYEAIAVADLERLMSIWSEEEETVCIHPTGQRLSGNTAIRESWKNIFAINPTFTVHITHQVRWESLMISVHSVVETLLLGEDPSQQGPMLSTNVFIRGASGWRLLSRHTSAANENSGQDAQLTQGGEHTRHTLH